MMQEMKDSGIKWIGDIPADWEVKKIKYIASAIFQGNGITKEDVAEDGDIFCVRYGEIYTKYNFSFKDCLTKTNEKEIFPRRYFSNGDILFVGTGESVDEIGKNVAYLGDEICLAGGDIIILRHSQNPVFLSYAMNSQYGQAQKSYGKAKLKVVHISPTDIGNLIVLLPPIAEQQAIATFLDDKCSKLDSIIADLERQIEILQEYKDSIITTAISKGLDGNVATHDSGVEWIGKIPDGWKLSRIKYLVDANHPYPIGDGDHGLVSVDDYLAEGIPYIRVLNLTWGYGLKMDNMVYISEDMNYKIRSSTLRPNDLLIAKTGATIGKTAIVPLDIPVSNTTSHVGKITLPDNHYPKFFFHMLNSSIIQKQIGDISAMQSTRPELGIDGLRNLVVIVPPFDEQEKIATYLDVMCEKSNNVLYEKYEQLDRINDYKSSLIYEYVTGKKRVKEAAIHAD